MALRSAWWMISPSATHIHHPPFPSPNTSSNAPHKQWLQSITASGLGFNELQKYLQNHPGNACQLLKFSFGNFARKLLWKENTCITDLRILENEVKQEVLLLDFHL